MAEQLERITQFRGSIFSLRTDRDGESRVQFDVPLSNMPSVTKLYLVLHEEVQITVERVTNTTT